MKLLHYCIISLTLFFLITGCSKKEIVKTFYLQDVEVTGPVNLAPVHITDTFDVPSFTISPRFSYNTQKQILGTVEGHSQVNAQGEFEYETILNDEDGTVTYREVSGANIYDYEGRNLKWNTSTLTAGFDIDMKLSKHFALFGGLNYSVQNNKSIWGYIAGLGFFSQKNEMGIRVDGGLHIQNIYYDAYTLVSVTGDENYILFYHDKDKNAHVDPFVNITFNTAHKEWITNIFINAGFTAQTLSDFEPEKPDANLYLPVPPFLLPVNINRNVIVNDLRGESFASFVHFTPGVYFDVTEQSRILVGSRFYFETQIKNSDKNLFVMPFLQVDFVF